MKRRMIKLVMKIARSRVYFKLSALVAFFEEGCFLISGLARKIKMNFLILKKRLNNIVRKMRQRGASDGKRMYFYRLVRKFLPAFPKFYRLKI